MKKYLILLLIPFLIAAAPTRQNIYIDKETIEALDVTENEDVIFDYLQTGVDTYLDDSIEDSDIDWGSSSGQIDTDDVPEGSTNKFEGTTISGTTGTTTGEAITIVGSGISSTSVTGDTLTITSTENDTLDSVTDRCAITTNTIQVGSVYGGSIVTGETIQATSILTDGTATLSSGVLTGASGNISQWTNDEGYSKNDTLQSVTNRSPVTTAIISAGGLYSNATTSGIDVRATNTVSGSQVEASRIDIGSGPFTSLQRNATGLLSSSSITASDFIGDLTGTIKTASQPNITSATGLAWTGMATGTDGQIPTFDASGNPSFVATGTATHVLTSNGAGASPTFQAAAGGGATVYLGEETRAHDGASGDVSYTGYGFEPLGLVVIACVNSNDEFSIGFSDGDGRDACIKDKNGTTAGTWGIESAQLIAMSEDASKEQNGSLKTMDADGYTITWTRAGASASTTIYFYVWAIK